VTQLSSEEESRALGILIPKIVSIGEPALDGIANINREAHNNYVSNVQLLVALTIATFERRREYSALPDDKRANAMQDDARNAFDEIDKHISAKLNLKLLNPSEARLFGQTIVDSSYEGDLTSIRKTKPFFDIAAGEDKTFGVLPHMITLLAPLVDRSEKEELVTQITKDALVLFNSSIALSRIIGNLSGKLKRKNLSSIALVSADLTGVSLDEVDLRLSFIAGKATETRLVGAHLEGANLSNLVFEKTNLSYAFLDGATLPNATVGYVKNSELTGANWWDTANVLQLGTRGAFLNFSDDGTLRSAAALPCGPGRGSELPRDLNEILRHNDVLFILCRNEKELAAERSNFEAAFPRGRNEQLRDQRIKAHSIPVH
jgi:uncharacterized protein YjbI with pentapeptide repeats